MLMVAPLTLAHGIVPIGALAGSAPPAGTDAAISMVHSLTPAHEIAPRSTSGSWATSSTVATAPPAS